MKPGAHCLETFLLHSFNIACMDVHAWVRWSPDSTRSWCYLTSLKTALELFLNGAWRAGRCRMRPSVAGDGEHRRLVSSELSAEGARQCRRSQGPALQSGSGVAPHLTAPGATAAGMTAADREHKAVLVLGGWASGGAGRAQVHAARLHQLPHIMRRVRL